MASAEASVLMCASVARMISARSSVEVTALVTSLITSSSCESVLFDGLMPRAATWAQVDWLRA